MMIKMDERVVKKLYEVASSWSDFVKLTKMVCYRFNLGLLENMQK
jgi:hypothetical protein